MKTPLLTAADIDRGMNRTRPYILINVRAFNYNLQLLQLLKARAYVRYMTVGRNVRVG